MFKRYGELFRITYRTITTVITSVVSTIIIATGTCYYTRNSAYPSCTPVWQFPKQFMS